MSSITVSRKVNAPPERVWQILTDLEGAPGRISAIQEIKRVDTGGDFGVGTEWIETRTMFGKQATEQMRVTEVNPGTSYTTLAESHGARYVSTMKVVPDGGGSVVSMEFTGEPQTLAAKVMVALTGWMFRKATAKACEQDLDDIAQAAEAAAG